MQKARRKSASERGNALLSVAIGLVLVSVILAGVIMWFSRTQRQAKIANLAGSVMQLQMSVEKGFMNRAAYDGLDAQWVIDAGVLPDSLSVSSGADIRHGLGGRIWLGTHTTADSEFPHNSMQIGLQDLDTDACFQLIQQIAPQHSDQLYAFRIGDYASSTGTTYFNGAGYPSVDQILDECRAAAQGSSSVQFYFRK